MSPPLNPANNRIKSTKKMKIGTILSALFSGSSAFKIVFLIRKNKKKDNKTTVIIKLRKK